MRDFLPEDIRRRQHVIGAIESVYRRYGFEPLETPAVENIGTLLGKYGEEGNQLIFKILKRGEHEASGQADLALRYDLTVPLARVVAEHRARLPRFFKRYQIQPVWRADRPARGRFREFYQCDVDVVGSTSPLVEAEVCGLLDVAGVPGTPHGDALVALDKLDKIGREGVGREFASRDIPPAAGERVLDFFTGIAGLAEVHRDDPGRHNAEVIARLGALVTGHGPATHGLTGLADILALSGATAAAGRLRVDPSLARGLSYYTGAIMEIAVPDLAGSLGGGGRYDNLVGMFLGHDVPAVGFSLGLERIIVVMGERGMFPASLAGAGADVMVTLWNAAGAAGALSLARDLRAAGLRVDVYPEADKLGRQFKYAASVGVPLVAVMGEDEAAAGTVTVKDLRTGEQVTLARAEVAGYARQRLGG